MRLDRTGSSAAYSFSFGWPREARTTTTKSLPMATRTLAALSISYCQCGTS
jgi:hypothetical protein